MPEESQIESREHQDNADIHDQPFPETVSKECEVESDDRGNHRQHIKQDNYPASGAVHFVHVPLALPAN
ncbi:MAG TPA: hypothetical protein VGT78_07305 [Rhizomicrobium sp.]|nr:hypothetical protein [Rhizomicrobium sp.]